jgi:hypothetical protein
MGAIYDLFERLPEGPMWVESFTTLQEITERLVHLNATRPREYFVYNVRESKIVAEFPNATVADLPASPAAAKTNGNSGEGSEPGRQGSEAR